MLRRLAIVALLVASATAVAHAGEQTVRLNIHNMTCAFCGPIVQWALESTRGVISVVVTEDYALTPPVVATVVFDDSLTNIAALIAVTTTLGFPAIELLPGYEPPALELGDGRNAK